VVIESGGLQTLRLPGAIMLSNAPSAPRKLCFGLFELDLRAGELHRNGRKVKLQDQPFQILAILLEHPGEVVTREELQARLWPGDNYGDFEHSISMAVRRLREALDDSADNPRFVETLPRHGYRFMVPVEELEPATRPASAKPAKRRAMPIRHWVVAFALVALLATSSYLAWQRFRPSAKPPAGKVMLVVLPFENLSGDPGQEYFSDGFTEEMTAQLALLYPEQLAVIGRATAMTYKHAKKTIDEVGRELHVQYVLEGSVRKGGERVRITAELVKVGDQTHVWAQNYEGDLRDVVSMQREVAQKIAKEMPVKISPQGQARLARARPVNPEAQDAYLRGIYRLRQNRPDSGTTAASYFRQATEIQSDWALPYAGLADAHRWNATDPDLDLADRREFFRESKAAASKALALDDNLAEAHSLLGNVLQEYEWDWAGAQREFKRALHLDPSAAGAHAGYGRWLNIMGRYQEAIPEYERAIELDPLFLLYRVSSANTYKLARRYDEAIQRLQETVSLEPSFAEAHAWLSEAYARKGRYEEAIAELERQRALRNPPSQSVYLANLAFVDAVTGRRSEALKIVQENRALLMANVTQPTAVAGLYCTIGDKDETYRWLEIAFRERDPKLPVYRWSSDFDNIRSDPRFQDLVRRMNLPQ
jgi:TolB-like protein/DNA-binding winged helix-turn-helix (wHTH) protein/Tfp pilus assembly protein PilF